MKRAEVLSVKIDDVSLGEAIEMVKGWLSQGGKRYIVTPNPEIIMAAQKDRLFKDILNKADLSIPDGVGLKLSGEVKNTTTGTDLMEGLVKLASSKSFKIGLIGGRDGVADKLKMSFLKKYPSLKVVYAESGGIVAKNGQSDITLNIPPTDILFVAFGHVKQEKWIDTHLKSIPVKVVMGVGGAVDYLSGEVPRAPKWIRSLGFEWLFRLVVQPWRMKRQFSLIYFAFLVLAKKLKLTVD